MALLWIAKHTETKKKRAAASRPKLQEKISKIEGVWDVQYVDLGKLDKEKAEKLYEGKGYIEAVKEKMMLLVEAGKVKKKRE